MSRLTRRFFEDTAPSVARAILGAVLVRVVGGRRLSGRIVEAEAYRGSGDPASHAFRGRTMRNSVMFGEPGHAYLYFTYGNHWCLNLTTEPLGRPAAVLLRALEPLEGLGTMMKNRGVDDERQVTNGPGKLTKALGIGGEFNGEDVVSSERLFLEEGLSGLRIGRSSRVGITTGTERPWRFFVMGNRFVSGGRPASIAPRSHK